jgi:Domain of Unknown Function (DUF1080)/Carbohydrate esterase, sialic acid-specific acetylesterase
MWTQRIARGVWLSVIIGVLGMLLAERNVSAEIALPAIFGDGMVLQRESQARFWGWAQPGETVTLKGSWTLESPAAIAQAEAIRVVAQTSGVWEASLPTPKAGGPFTVSISGEPGRSGGGITLRDVLIGEVWICSGQSNMEWPVSVSSTPERTIADAIRPMIRLFTVENTMSLHEERNLRAADAMPGSRSGWRLCLPSSVANFSAVGYSFGRQVQDGLARAGEGDVPIGLISADWGGTVAQAWMSERALKAFPEFTPILRSHEAMRDPSRRAAGLLALEDAWWRSLDGLQPRALAPDWVVRTFADTAWGNATLPAGFGPGQANADGLAELADFDGAIFFRKVVRVDEAHARKPAVLTLGPIDDRDESLVNGVRIGATRQDGQWAQPRSYKIPAGVLEAGDNVIALRVVDTAGLGAVGTASGKASAMSLILNDGAGPTIDLGGAWRVWRGTSMAELPAMPIGAQVTPNSPGVLFGGMISPLMPMTIRGAIWYQGESNRYDPALYARLMPALIGDWRAGFRHESMPFYFVQIAPFRYSNDQGQTAELREAQAKTLRVPHTGMAVTMDIGDTSDIHPRNKAEVGRRLALLALKDTYGQAAIEASGPVVDSVRLEPGRASLTFTSVGGGLVLGREGRGFELAGDDRVFHPAKARIESPSLVTVTSHAVPEPVAVRYAFGHDATGDLSNAAGLPAAPFRTDTWERGTWKAAPPPDVRSCRGSDEGFVPLFNGKDLSGWINVNTAPSTWTTWTDEQGEPIIRCTGKPTGVLRTGEMYENFVLELEYRHLVPGGNAGLFVWSDAITARGVPFTRSVEVQVMDGREADWYTSDGDIFPIHGATMVPENARPQDPTRAYPTERRARPSPEWNHYRVTCIDGEISLAVNGKIVTRGREGSPRKGYICLESEGSPVDFRHIRLKSLPPSELELEPEQIARAADGFVPLYTGVDLSGWKETPAANGSTGHWFPSDWVLKFDGVGETLWSEKSYKDFTMIADWRWCSKPISRAYPVILPDGREALDASGKPITQAVDDAGDSGIYLRGSDKSQVNIWCWPIGSGEVYGYRTDGSMPADVRAGVTPKSKADRPIGEWNRFEITMKGEVLTVRLNGTVVIEGARLPGVPAEGPIALQAHGSAIEFANLMIREE